MLARIFSVAALVAFASPAFSQTQIPKAPKRNCQRVYLGFSTGFNNKSGIMGLNADVGIVDHVGVSLGVGRGTWGWKYYAEGIYYFSRCSRGWGLAAGFSRSSGIKEFEIEMQTISSEDELIKLKLDPLFNFNFSGLKVWNLGKKDNRFYVQAGWSQALGNTRYTQLTGAPITNDSKNVLEMLSPGGPIVAVGFSFAVAGE